MKTISKMFIIAVLITGLSFGANAQAGKGKLRVSTQLKEINGSHEQRKLYRTFLISYMKNCPYISNFKMDETAGASDNHEVTWNYDVNSWNDITSFYNWIEEHLKSGKDDGLKKALTPYKPDYALGGKIRVQKRGKSALAKN